MPLPISEIIAADILTTTQGVTVANGYTYNLSAMRHSRAGDKREHLNAIIVQGDPKEVTGKVYNTYEWILPFEIGVFVIPTLKDPTPIDQYINIIRADVEKALMVDRYRSGNALDSTIRASATNLNEGAEGEIIVINIDVNYRTSELDPYINAK